MGIFIGIGTALNNLIAGTNIDNWSGLVTWLDATPAYYTIAAQPANLNSNFATWISDGYNTRPTYWILPTAGGAEYYLSNATNACRMRSDGTAIGLVAQSSGVVGNQYLNSLNITSITGVGISPYDPGSTYNTIGVKTYETTNNIGLGVKRAAGGSTDATFTDLVFTNLSITAATPRSGTLINNFVQATATLQPYRDLTTGYIRLNADRLVSSAAASNYKFLSDGYASSWAIVFKLNALTADSAIFGAYDGAAGSVGIFCRAQTTGSIRLAIGRGGGYALDQSSTTGLVNNTNKHILVGNYAGSGNYIVRLDGTQIISGA